MSERTLRDARLLTQFLLEADWRPRERGVSQPDALAAAARILEENERLREALAEIARLTYAPDISIIARSALEEKEP